MKTYFHEIRVQPYVFDLGNILHIRVVPDSDVSFISQMGIRCFTPVSDDRKKTATVHSLLSGK